MKKIVTFHGCDHKVGTTMLSQSVAEWIAQRHKELKVLWIVCSRGNGMDYADSVNESVAGLKGYLDNHLLKKEEVLQSCQRTDNLFMLGGVSSLLEERYYFPDTADYLLKSLEDSFDLIIADCGNDIDNGLCVGALTYGGWNVLVAKQSEVSLRRMVFLQEIYHSLHIVFTHLVINCFSEEHGLFPGEMAERLKIGTDSFHLVSQSDWGKKAEAENRTLLAYGSRKFQKDINQLAEWIMAACQLEQGTQRGRFSWKSFI